MKYKYYFRKPKSEIVKDLLHWLFVAGCICFAATSPYFFINLLKAFKRWRKSKKYNRRKVYDAFHQLRKKGAIKIERKEHQVYIRLTEEGKKLAGWSPNWCPENKEAQKMGQKVANNNFWHLRIKKIIPRCLSRETKRIGILSSAKERLDLPFWLPRRNRIVKRIFWSQRKRIKINRCRKHRKRRLAKKNFQNLNEKLNKKCVILFHDRELITHILSWIIWRLVVDNFGLTGFFEKSYFEKIWIGGGFFWFFPFLFWFPLLPKLEILMTF